MHGMRHAPDKANHPRRVLSYAQPSRCDRQRRG